jgi:hypothetical protein
MDFIALALSLSATVYGLNENMCGSIEPMSCNSDAITASGMMLTPHLPTAAIPMPQNRIMRPFFICLKNPETSKEAMILVNDKTHHRWVGKRGFDLSPEAFRQLTGKDPQSHSQIPKLVRCS